MNTKKFYVKYKQIIDICTDSVDALPVLCAQLGYMDGSQRTARKDMRDWSIANWCEGLSNNTVILRLAKDLIAYRNREMNLI